MISCKQTFIFTRVAKTGSTSVIQALRSGCEYTELDVSDRWRYDKNHFPTRIYKEALSDLGLSSLYKNYFKFAIVRNPWDRFVSIFHHVVFGNHDRGWLRKYGAKPVRRDCFKELLTRDDNIFKTFRPIKHLGLMSKYGNQYDFTLGCDFIGRFENLQQDFNTICNKIGIKQRQLPVLNNTNHKHYSEYYDDETREIIAQVYSKDIKYFGYKFDS